jgi:hypothetical protein
MVARSVLAIVVALIGLNGVSSHVFAAQQAALPKEIDREGWRAVGPDSFRVVPDGRADRRPRRRTR